MNSKIRTREEIPLIIDTVSRLAKMHGIRVEEILPNASVSEPILKDNEGQYFSVPLLIKARAGYHNFGKFINQIEREENFFTLGDFSIETNPMDATHPSIKMNLNAIVFEAKGN
jgi:Tfp pilus assembly protein PilO